MSNHTTALVPIETLLYASPELNERGVIVDIGLFAEALVYYDNLFVSVGNPSQFASFIEWFTQKELLKLLLELIREGTLQFYDYAFITTSFVNGSHLKLYHVNDIQMIEPNSFVKRVLENSEVINAFPTPQCHKEFCRLLENRVVEVKADAFADAITNAESDFVNPSRSAVLLQTLLDELFALKNLGSPPIVKNSIRHVRRGDYQIEWHIDLDTVASLLGYKGIDHRAPPSSMLVSSALNGAGLANRYLLTAMQHDVDLYLPRPLSLLAGDKLYEASIEETTNPQELIDVLQESVEFPDLRYLVNNGEIDFSQVLLFRQKGEKFRKWLQDEVERDRDALFAYHNEVAREAGFIRNVRKGLSLFGKLGGSSAAGSIAGTLLSPDPILGGAIGAAIGDKLSFLSELGSKYGEWKPVVFGNWYKDRIAKIKEAREVQERLLNPIGIKRAKQQAEEKRLRKARKKARRRK